MPGTEAVLETQILPRESVLDRSAATTLRLAAEALERAAQGAAKAAPTTIKAQDDDIASAVFAEIAAAEKLIQRSYKHR
jgi:hypothetical protein